MGWIGAAIPPTRPLIVRKFTSQSNFSIVSALFTRFGALGSLSGASPDSTLLSGIIGMKTPEGSSTFPSVTSASGR